MKYKENKFKGNHFFDALQYLFAKEMERPCLLGVDMNSFSCCQASIRKWNYDLFVKDGLMTKQLAKECKQAEKEGLDIDIVFSTPKMYMDSKFEMQMTPRIIEEVNISVSPFM